MDKTTPDKKRIKQRPMTKMLKRVYGDQPVVGAEVGVATGKNARSILWVLNMKRLYLIDPYIYYAQYQLHPGSLERTGIAARKLLEPFPQAVWIHKPSHEAIADIPELLDFAYIDGEHSYDYVARDIDMYSKIIKEGGFLGGHDYCTTGHRHTFAVKIAVDERVTQHGWKLNLVGNAKCSDWWVQV